MPLRPPTVVVAMGLTLAGCQREQHGFEQRAEPRQSNGAVVEPEVAPARSMQRLIELLDAVPAGADFAVIRDLSVLVESGVSAKQTMEGPLDRALAALGGPAATELEQLRLWRSQLGKLLLALDAADVALDRGMVLAESDHGITISFAADDLGALELAHAIGESSFDPSRDCARAEAGSNWWVCSPGGPEVLATYVPAGLGRELLAQARKRLPGVDLEAANVIALADPFMISLRTDPGLWELSVPIDLDIFRPGPTPGLASFEPGVGFVWARVDPVRLASSSPVPVPAELLSGEIAMGPMVAPPALIVRLGVLDSDRAVQLLTEIGKGLPKDEFEPIEDTFLTTDDEPIDIGGRSVASIGFAARGPAVDAIGLEAMGLEPCGRLWTDAGYLNLALGSCDGSAASLAARTTAGPAPDFAAGLPSTLVAALGKDELGLVFSIALDPWQAPLSGGELDGLGAALGVAPGGVSDLFGGLTATFASWSSATLWMRRAPSGEWILHFSLLPFVDPEASAGEREASLAVLELVRQGRPTKRVYDDLLAQFPDSRRSAAWRARAGQVPPLLMTFGAAQAGIVFAVLSPAVAALASESE